MMTYLKVNTIKAEIIQLVTQSADEDLLDLVLKLLIAEG